MIVDDEAATRAVLTTLLHDEGFDVLEAADGQQALDLLAGSPAVDVILLDGRMPRLDGYEFLARRSVDRRIVNVPVIFISATPERHRLMGAVSILPKPFDLAELSGALDRCTGHRARPSAVPRDSARSSD